MSDWTDERIALLRQLFNAGFSASQIASRMGGVSRNAVIGKLHRLALNLRNKPRHAVRKGPEPTQQRPSRRPVTLAAVAKAAEPVKDTPDAFSPLVALRERVKPVSDYTQRKLIAETAYGCTAAPRGVGPAHEFLRPRDCKWPVGEGAGFHFCSARRAPGSPYCAEHTSISFNPITPRKRRLGRLAA